jgi:(+)-pinoresinol hydroxylase
VRVLRFIGQVALGVGAAGAAAAGPGEGKRVFDQWCAECHAPGPGHPGTQSLQVKYRGSLAPALEERTDLTQPITSFYVRSGVALMPFFRKTEISDADLRELAAYLAKGKP